MTLAWIELGFFVLVICLGVVLRSWVVAQIAKRPWVGIMFGILEVVAVSHAIFQFQAQHDRGEIASGQIWAKHARTWSRTPLRVRYDRVKFHDYESAIRADFDLYNDDVGCDLLVLSNDGDYDVELAFYENNECVMSYAFQDAFDDKKTVAGVLYCTDGRAQVLVKRLDGLEASYPVLAHEFGHVLGLEHYPGTFMAAGDVSHLSFQQVRLSKPAIEALRARYCAKQEPR